MEQKEYERLEIWLMQELKDDWDKIDLKSEVDMLLTFEENKRIISEKVELVKEREIKKQTEKEYLILNSLNQYKPILNFWGKIKNDLRVVVVVGDSGSGKTAFSFKLLEQFDRDVYIYKHPKANMIEAIGYKNMSSLSELSRITNAVIYFDEPQLSFPKSDKQTNDTFLNLCSVARQNDITLIFSTSDTRWVNRGLESYVSHWIVKNIDVNLVKQGSIVKKIIRNIMPLAQDELILNPSEYLFYSRKNNAYNGRHEFIMPVYYSDVFSKAYRNETAKGTARKMLDKLRKV